MWKRTQAACRSHGSKRVHGTEREPVALPRSGSGAKQRGINSATAVPQQERTHGPAIQGNATRNSGDGRAVIEKKQGLSAAADV